MVNEIPHASRVRAPIGNSDEAQQSVGICLSVAVAVCALLGAASQPAGAEDALEELVVTGTRIAAPNLKSTSPVVAISSTDLKLGGHTDITDVLNLLPQISSNSLGQDLGNRTSGLTAAGGVATADLRGLGPNRTLVLVDGRRLGAGSPNTAIQSPAPDLDQIPSALIERVEVVTGGASAVYGSDAIAGVVNFIMKKNFEGLQLDYQIGANQHSNHSTFSQNVQRDAGYTPLTGSTWDGQNTTASVIAGANILDGAGNVTAYFNYLKANPVRSGQRDFGGCQLNANSTLTGATCSGSGNSNYFEPTDSTINPQGNAYSVKGSQFVDWGTAGTQPPTLFNTQPYIYMAREDVRYNAGFLAHVDVNEHVKPYLEFGFMNDRTHQEIAPTALYEDANPLDPISGNYNINCSNPLLSAQQASLLCTPAQIAADAATPGSVSANVRIGRRNVEGGGRSSDFEHTNYRVVGGAKGEILKGWTYDAYAQYYYTSFFTSNNQYLSFQAIDNALQVKGTAANPVCISGGSCVPYNIFSDNGVTQAALAPMYLSGTAFGSNTLRTIHADVTGDLGKYGLQSPLASGGVGVNFGYEHRAEHVKFQPDSGELSGLLSGFGGASVPINNGYKVDEEFIELRAPLVQDRPGVKDLVFDTGYRHSQYSTAGGVSTYKFEVQYAPVDDLRLRGSFNRATRVPSIIELYNPQLVGQISYGTDPCSPTTDVNNQPVAAAATLAQCQRTGVTAAQYGNGLSTNTVPQGTASQLSQLQGGNPNLRPEAATTYTIGATLTPVALPSFTGSLDYYHIKLVDEVGSLPATVIMTNCLNTGDPTYCSQIQRSVTGGLTGNSLASKGYFIQTNVNTGAAELSGLDLQAAYKLGLPRALGSLRFLMNGAYLLTDKSTPIPSGGTYDCAGLFGQTCQTVNPRWRHNLRVSWETPWDVSISATWRHFGKVSLDNNQSNGLLALASFSTINAFNAQIPAYNWLDLSASWDIWKNVQLRGGINNLFDKDPPIVTSEIVSGGAANSYEAYDGLGRQLFLAVTARF